MLEIKYYQTAKFKAAIAISIAFLCAAGCLLYFTITECIRECENNQEYPTPCSFQEQSYCCSTSKEDIPYAC
jgi:hypothetical protein